MGGAYVSRPREAIERGEGVERGEGGGEEGEVSERELVCYSPSQQQPLHRLNHVW